MFKCRKSAARKHECSGLLLVSCGGVVKFNMADSLSIISESLAAKDSRLNDIMPSPAGNNVKKSLTSEDDFVGEKESFIENKNGEQKPADEHKSLEVETLKWNGHARGRSSLK